MADRIFVEGLLISAVHGVQRRERREAQEFLLDISVVFDTSTAGASDRIADTIDYGHLRDIAQRAFAETPRRLLERLATQIAAEILLDPRVTEATISIRKPHVYPDCVSGISIIRHQSSL